MICCRKMLSKQDIRCPATFLCVQPYALGVMFLLLLIYIIIIILGTRYKITGICNS